jgi:hypothetical protein
MATERTQNLSNHAQWTPAYHFVTVPLGLLYLGWAVRRVMENGTADNWFILVGALALTGAISVSRLQALKVQDRVIRLEERLRLTALLPADLQPHIGRLRASHLIALRFASDDEVPALVREIVANPGITPKAIKGRVRNWRSDWFRA